MNQEPFDSKNAEEHLAPSEQDELIVGFVEDLDHLPEEPHIGCVTLDRRSRLALRYGQVIQHFLKGRALVMEKGVFDHLRNLFQTDGRLADYALDLLEDSNTCWVDMQEKVELYNEYPDGVSYLEMLPYLVWCETREDLEDNGRFLGAFVERPADGTRLYQIVDTDGIDMPGHFYWTASDSNSGRSLHSLVDELEDDIEKASAAIGKRHPRARRH